MPIEHIALANNTFAWAPLGTPTAGDGDSVHALVCTASACHVFVIRQHHEPSGGSIHTATTATATATTTASRSKIAVDHVGSIGVCCGITRALVAASGPAPGCVCFLLCGAGLIQWEPTTSDGSGGGGLFLIQLPVPQHRGDAETWSMVTFGASAYELVIASQHNLAVANLALDPAEVRAPVTIEGEIVTAVRRHPSRPYLCVVSTTVGVHLYDIRELAEPVATIDVGVPPGSVIGFVMSELTHAYFRGGGGSGDDVPRWGSVFGVCTPRMTGGGRLFEIIVETARLCGAGVGLGIAVEAGTAVTTLSGPYEVAALDNAVDVRVWNVFQRRRTMSGLCGVSTQHGFQLILVSAGQSEVFVQEWRVCTRRESQGIEASEERGVARCMQSEPAADDGNQLERLDFTRVVEAMAPAEEREQFVHLTAEDFTQLAPWIEKQVEYPQTLFELSRHLEEEIGKSGQQKKQRARWRIDPHELDEALQTHPTLQKIVKRSQVHRKCHGCNGKQECHCFDFDGEDGGGGGGGGGGQIQEKEKEWLVMIQRAAEDVVKSMALPNEALDGAVALIEEGERFAARHPSYYRSSTTDTKTEQKTVTEAELFEILSRAQQGSEGEEEAAEEAEEEAITTTTTTTTTTATTTKTEKKKKAKKEKKKKEKEKPEQSRMEPQWIEQVAESNLTTPPKQKRKKTKKKEQAKEEEEVTEEKTVRFEDQQEAPAIEGDELVSYLSQSLKETGREETTTKKEKKRKKKKRHQTSTEDEEAPRAKKAKEDKGETLLEPQSPPSQQPEVDGEDKEEPGFAPDFLLW
jgi:hypothetical protein